MHPPIAKKIPTSRTMFGITLQDNYAWMRQKDDPRVKAYLDAENAYTEQCMVHTEAFQQVLYDEMLGRIKEDDQSAPYQKGAYWYYVRTEAGKPYAIHCRRKGSMEAEEEVLIDENVLAEGKDFFDLGDLEISTNEQLMAYTVDENGSEHYQLHVKNLETGEIQADVVSDIYGEVEWANDNKTIYYVILEESTFRPYKLFRHLIGGNQDDVLIFHEADEAYFLSLGKTKDEKYLVIDLSSNITTEAWYLNANEPEMAPSLVASRRQGIEFGLAHNAGWWYIVTNEDAVNFRLMRTRVSTPARENWEEVIAHDSQSKIDAVDSFKDHLVILGRNNGLKNIQVRNLRTGDVHDISHPEPVYTVGGGANVEFDTDQLRFSYSSLTQPASVFEYDLNTRSRKMLKQTVVLGGYNPSDYTSERIFAVAADGTKVPISLVYKKALRQDGPQAFLLYAYGSYGHSIEPHFSSARLSMLDRGMVFAMAHIRGGGEMGRPWYEDGKFLNKKNTFTDFIAAAEHVCAAGYTEPSQLGIMGGSAGGLLMGAVVNMRPDLFKVVEAHVPFVDIMNTMLDPTIPLTVIEYDEWGNPQQEDYFRYMHAYSPYDNVVAQDYPDMLITAGLNDPRVHYWEPAKWCARLRDHKTDANTLLLKTNMGAGHKGASGRYGHLKETAFEYAFLLDHLGISCE
ncbi:MAG TPA: S9 family peptidase [Bacteroidetes bacterium]|nr:S9 family peptidase [Bacteroidota bacterium]